MFRRFTVILIIAVAAASVVTASSTAAITTCSSKGLISSLSVQYGVCQTNLSGGSGSVMFLGSGQTASLSAKARSGAEQVVGFWSSNGPVAATEEICVNNRVNSLSLQGSGTVKLVLQVSYDGSFQDTLSTGVDTLDTYSACDPIPLGATNVWWQLQAIATAPARGSQTAASVTLTSVNVF